MNVECNELTSEIAKTIMMVNMKIVIQIVNKIFTDLTLFCSLSSLTYKIIIYSRTARLGKWKDVLTALIE